MSSLRKLERSVIMHKSYELCGSSAMFHTLWKKHRKKHHYKDGVKTVQSNVNPKKQLKKDKRVLGKIKSRLLSKKKNTVTPATAVTMSN